MTAKTMNCLGWVQLFIRFKWRFFVVVVGWLLLKNIIFVRFFNSVTCTVSAISVVMWSGRWVSEYLMQSDTAHDDGCCWCLRYDVFSFDFPLFPSWSPRSLQGNLLSSKSIIYSFKGVVNSMAMQFAVIWLHLGGLKLVVVTVNNTKTCCCACF